MNLRYSGESHNVGSLMNSSKQCVILSSQIMHL